jgi:molybdopterin converting factor small subunit/tRNA threonylcarbamoyladenosine modification (KEOPS) complex Cgi121 subunit
MIKVKLLGSFSQGIGKEIEVEGVTDVLGLLERFRGKNRELYPENPNIIVLVNGIEVGVLNGLKTKLKDGDEVIILPAAHGGSTPDFRFKAFRVKGLSIDRLEEVRKGLRSVIIQACGTECVYSYQQLYYLALQTWEAIDRKELLAEKPEMDFLLRLAIDDQITSSVKLCGLHGQEGFLVIFGKEEAVIEAERRCKASFDLQPLEEDYRAEAEKFMKRFNISEAELTSTSSQLDPLTSILVERASLLILKRE